MHRVMSANDGLGSRYGNVTAYPPGSGSPEQDYLGMNLSTCLHSTRNAATKAQGAKSHAERVTLANFTNELVNGCTSKRSTAVAHDTYEDVQTSTPDCSEDCHETTRLDREVRRLQVLKSYLGVLDAEHGNKFERLTALASRIFSTPMATVTIADLNKQYCVSSRGMGLISSMKSTFCSEAVLADCDLMVVNDASTDKRFADDPQVIGYPNVRFYAGAPLICPEGYRLGTLCVMDSNPRSQPVTLEEKQSLIELAAMAMENLVELRKKKEVALRDPSQQIACTAHDLLTPLTGIALSLSLLKEDEGLQEKLSEQQRDMIETAANCSTVMNNICHKTMDFFREQGRPADAISSKRTHRRNDSRIGPPTVNTSVLVKNLNMVMEPFPKQVPIIITVDDGVPPEFVSNDMKIFRSASNFLTNASAKTESGSITLRIFKRNNPDSNEEELVFECEDTGPGVDVSQYAHLFKPVHEEHDPLRLDGSQAVLKNMSVETLREGVRNSGLGLYSVATQIGSLGGKYGFRPRNVSGNSEASKGGKNGNGSVFWFSIPLVLPGSAMEAEDLAKCAAMAVADASSPAVALRRSNASFTSTRRSSGMIRVGSFTECGQKRSDESLSRLHNEDALEAFAAPRSGMTNKRFRVSETERMPQALVIEDSNVVRKSLSRALTKLGFEVAQAINGMEGLKELKNSLFDVVFCDFLMPVMDGLDCIQQYRQWETVNRPFFKIYIIGISAHANTKDVDQAFKVGMDGFRSKPLLFKDVERLKKGSEFRRKKAELDKLGNEIESLKRQKIETETGQDQSAAQEQKVCLVFEGTPVISKLAEIATASIDWQIVSVVDSDSALGLLKMRNWDAVLVDDDLGCNRCVSIFREWEKKHRVNRQQNIILMSANYVPTGYSGASFQVPTGFDAALAKPIELKTLQSFFQKARSDWEIVAR